MTEKLFSLIEKKELEEARQTAYNYIEKMQTDEQFVILFILFKIRDAELESDEQDIFSSPAGSTPNELITHYTKIKFYLRRYEYGLPDYALDEALNYFIDNKVSVNALYKIAEFACVQPNIVYEMLALDYEQIGMTAYKDALLSLS